MTDPKNSFFNIYQQGFARLVAASPSLKTAEPDENAKQTLAMIEQAHDEKCALIVFPELGISSYAIDDLMRQQVLLDASKREILRLKEASCELMPLILVGAPLQVDGAIYNCAFALHRGHILGIVPKSYLPNYSEFYEARQFASGLEAIHDHVQLAGETVPFGTDLIFTAQDIPGFSVHAEICEDGWVPIATGSRAALAGATIIANLSASTAGTGKAERRKEIWSVSSQLDVCAMVYAAIGPGDSTTDFAWDGQISIHENGHLIKEGKTFPSKGHRVMADVDLTALISERARKGVFSKCADENDRSYRRILFSINPPTDADIGFYRPVARFPFVPDSEDKKNQLCEEACAIQTQGLAQRLRSTGIKNIVLGVSGGIDSTHALMIASAVMDQLSLPRSNILAYFLPAMATSSHTRETAHALMQAVGVTASEIDLHSQCRQMLKDIGHHAADGEELYDRTFENVQAGARAATLFRLANKNDALVLGTSDLSEIALGWSTYGVGDQMSHYNVNISAPKTLLQHLIRWQAMRDNCPDELREILLRVLDTVISPELVPGKDNSAPSQETELAIGPYALHDFFLFYVLRYGFSPSRIAYLAWRAWKDKSQGEWPVDLPMQDRGEYGLAEIVKWLRVFVLRFYQSSQFKRSASPNGPRLTLGGSLSPRGDWRAPADVSARIWLEELEQAISAAKE